MVQYHADINYEATIEKFQAFCSSHSGFSFEVTGGRKRAGAQIVAHFKDANVTMNIYHTGLIQITYETIPRLEKGIKVLELCCVSNSGRFELNALGPDDPLDRSMEFTTITHWEHTDKKCAMATVLLYWWWNHETGVYICRIPDREGRVEAPEGPYVFDCRAPVTIHAVDEFDEQGNKIATAEKLRWKMIQELRYVAKKHPRVRFQDGRAVDVEEG